MRVLAAAVVVIAMAIPIVSCGKPAPQPAATPLTTAPQATTTSVSSASVAPTTAKPLFDVRLSCYLDASFSNKAEFAIGEALDFGKVWAARPVACEAKRSAAPLTTREKNAIAAAAYSESSVRLLYGMCAEVDDGDVYTNGRHSPSPAQIQEITGLLILCPGHPLAPALKATADRGATDARLEASGRLFGAGTYRVGEQIKPGTYVSEGDIADCYWERTDSTGSIIDNKFVTGAKRVQVTIRAGDYSFHSERCGQWRGR